MWLKKKDSAEEEGGGILSTLKPQPAQTGPSLLEQTNCLLTSRMWLQSLNTLRIQPYFLFVHYCYFKHSLLDNPKNVHQGCWLWKNVTRCIENYWRQKKEELRWWNCSMSIHIALIKDNSNCLSSIFVGPKQKKITNKVHSGTFQVLLNRLVMSSEGHWFFKRKVTVYVRVVTSSSEISSATGTTGKHWINVQHINTNVAAGGLLPR